MVEPRKSGRPGGHPPAKRKVSYGASRGHAAPAGGSPRPERPRKAGQISPNRRHGFGQGKRPYDYSYYEKAEATPKYLAELFGKNNFTVSKRELSAYWKYYCLLREHNAALDLTRIMGIEATVLKHFIDCAIVADMVPLAKTLVDIGSGPGFPGVPLALRCPETKVILAESRGKRVRFLEMVKKELGLDNVEIFPRSVTADTPLEAEDFITRAVEVIPATLARLAPFIPVGGRALFMKGPSCGQEVTDAQQQFKGVFKMTADIRYELVQRDQQRRLVVFTKREESPRPGGE